MSELKHTPGPFELEEQPGGRSWDIICKESGVHLASVRDATQRKERGYLAGNEILGNARLFAASADLLEALQLALPYVVGAYQAAFPDEWKNEEVEEKVKAAINKATQP